MVKGEEAKSGKYREFMDAIKKAEYEAEVRLVAMWQKHMPENWQAKATFQTPLARCFLQRITCNDG